MRILIRVISVVGVIGVCVRVLFWIGIIIYSSRFAGVGIIGELMVDRCFYGVIKY